MISFLNSYNVIRVSPNFDGTRLYSLVASLSSQFASEDRCDVSKLKDVRISVFKAPFELTIMLDVDGRVVEFFKNGEFVFRMRDVVGEKFRLFVRFSGDCAVEIV